MGTTKTDTQAGQFDPTAMGAYKGISGGLGSTLPGFMTNPFGTAQFGLEQQMGTRQAQNLGQTGTSNLLRNMTTSGLFGGPSSAAGLEMLQNQGRANTGTQANLGFLAPYMAALNRQQYALGLGSQYRPLQTGQTQTEKTSGLGTWLPQVAGMGLGALGAAFGMPMGMGGGGGGGGAGGMGAFGEGGAGVPWMGGQPGMGSAIPNIGDWGGLGSVQPPAPGGGGGSWGQATPGGGIAPWMTGGNAP